MTFHSDPSWDPHQPAKFPMYADRPSAAMEPMALKALSGRIWSAASGLIIVFLGYLD